VARAAGARGYVLKGLLRKELRETIHSVMPAKMDTAGDRRQDHCTGGLASTPCPECWQTYTMMRSTPGKAFSSRQCGHLANAVGLAGLPSALCVPSRDRIISTRDEVGFCRLSPCHRTRDSHVRKVKGGASPHPVSIAMAAGSTRKAVRYYQLSVAMWTLPQRRHDFKRTLKRGLTNGTGVIWVLSLGRGGPTCLRRLRAPDNE
jgi:hypothetical protein